MLRNERIFRTRRVAKLMVRIERYLLEGIPIKDGGHIE